MVRYRLLGWVAVTIVVFVACGGGADGVSTSVATSATTPDVGVTGSVAPGEGVIVSPAGAEVSSDDGRLTLSFPAGAVADDVAVVVESVATGEWPAIMADLDPAAIVYRLEPSGLSFDEPVGFAMTVDIEIGDDGSVAAPLVAVVDDAGEGELVGLDVELDLEADIAVVTGTIGHFSFLVQDSGGLSVGLERVSPTDRVLDVSWAAVAVVLNLSRNDLIVTAVEFGAWGDVTPVGATSAPGFTLEQHRYETFDQPVPRWKCQKKGDGTYWVSVRATVGAGALVQGANALASFAGLDIRVESTTSYVVREFVDVTCVIPEYEASLRSGGLTSASGRVTDVLAPFTLQGTFEGGSATLSFVPEGLPMIHHETGAVGVNGSYTYTGSGGGTTIKGSGTFSIAGIFGQPLILTYNADGCAALSGGCEATSSQIDLTPIEQSQ